MDNEERRKMYLSIKKEYRQSLYKVEIKAMAKRILLKEKEKRGEKFISKIFGLNKFHEWFNKNIE